MSKTSFETLKGLHPEVLSEGPTLDKPKMAKAVSIAEHAENAIEAVKSLTETLTEVPRRQFLKQALLAGGAVAAASTFKPIEAIATKAVSKPISETLQPNAGQMVMDSLNAKDFSNLYGGNIPGLSDNQLKQHIGLYEGYVKKTNEINDKLYNLTVSDFSGANASYSTIRELLVERSFVHNGVILHELYFSNLGSNSTPSDGLKTLVNRDYGSWDNFMAQIIAAAKAMRGWVIIGFDMLDGKIHTYGLDTHSQGSPVMLYPLLVIDVYEHAYMIDFGTARAKYLDVLMANINWGAVNNRLMFAVHHLPSGANATV